MSVNKIFENDDVLDLFTKGTTLHDSTGKSICIYEINGVLTVDVEFELMHTKVGRHIRLRFTDVVEYSLHHNIRYYFCEVNEVKFIKDDNLYYLSMDPADTTQLRSEHDQDIVVGKKIQLFVIDTNALKLL